MTEPVYLVQGDTQPQISVQFTRSDDGSFVDISNSTVRMYVRERFETALALELTAILAAPTEGGAVFFFKEGDLDISAGEYEAEVEVVFNDGNRETIYERLDIIVREDFK